MSPVAIRAKLTCILIQDWVRIEWKFTNVQLFQMTTVVQQLHQETLHLHHLFRRELVDVVEMVVFDGDFVCQPPIMLHIICVNVCDVDCVHVRPGDLSSCAQLTIHT